MDSNPNVSSAGAAGGDAGVLPDMSPASGADGASGPPPVIKIREEHNISRRDIDPDALKVLYRLSRSNYTAYLVGGGVRDLLLGRKPKDFDISTNAKPEQIRAMFRNCILIGRRFRLAHIRYGEKIIETSTFRRTPESDADPADPGADLFQRDDNLFGTPQEDALRRDFTVNGLFYDIETFSIIDYVGGMEDLAARRIRSIGDPGIRFREDPVRMVRAVRFASRLDFTLDPGTLDAMVRHGDELAKAAPARLLEEIVRLFAFSSGEKAVRLLQSTGLLKVILPEVAADLGRDGDEDEAFWSRLRALDEGDTVLPDATPALIFATLLAGPLMRRAGRGWSADAFPRLKFDKVRSFIEPLALRLRFPRKLVDRIVHMFLDQHRFAGSGGKRGSIANFVTQESYHESLALAEIFHAAAAVPRAKLSEWRDMLAERIYGREDGHAHPERHGGAPRENNGNDAGTDHGNGNDGEESTGRKLSRSARRRRNKQMRRRMENHAAGQARDPAAAGGTESEEAAEKIAEAVNPVPPPAASAAAGGEETSSGKARRSRGRRGREKRKDAPETAIPRSLSESGAVSEPVRPLTAAAFYVPEEEPKKKRGGGKADSARTSRAKAKPDKTQNGEPPESGEAAGAGGKEKPLSIDRADEADTPMHWLDEI